MRVLHVAAAAAAVTCAAAGRTQNPSFLILLADDVGAGDVGYGCILNSTVVCTTQNAVHSPCCMSMHMHP
jgi:hypothetical protein